jgi:predicted dehydrogenase
VAAAAARLAADAAASQAGATTSFAAPPIPVVRIGYVGVGGQGSSHVDNLLKIDGCRITAVCDIRSERTDWATRAITAAGHPAPAVYARGPRDFERLCETEDLDLVYTATPWEWHVPVMLAAMAHGKHAATEVPAAMTLDDCWAIVEAAEKFRKHCLLMENCNYDRMEMMVFNMVRQGVFGEILHAEGGYLHDLRSIKFANEGEGLWRRAWATKLNGNLYPTHGLGPIANCLDINRGDRFDYLVSMSGPSRGLERWAGEHFPADAPQRRERYVLGDMNTSLIKTANGRTILVSHSTNLPRPYSRIHMLQGTRGIFQGYPSRVYIEGRSKAEDRWDDAGDWLAEYEHPLWKDTHAEDQREGHGGMDYLEDYRLIKCLREGTPTDMNVYDAAAISAVVHLSGQSIAKRSRPVDFPDFTRGRWKTNPKLEIVRG